LTLLLFGGVLLVDFGDEGDLVLRDDEGPGGKTPKGVFRERSSAMLAT
jgi:hypothetical protein